MFGIPYKELYPLDLDMKIAYVTFFDLDNTVEEVTNNAVFFLIYRNNENHHAFHFFCNNFCFAYSRWVKFFSPLFTASTTSSINIGNRNYVTSNFLPNPHKINKVIELKLSGHLYIMNIFLLT